MLRIISRTAILLAVIIGTSAAEADLLNYWTFDGNYEDSGTLDYTPTVNGTPTFGAAAPIAHSTGSLSLDPTNGIDYLRVGGNNDAISQGYESTFQGGFGISLWVQSDLAPAALAYNMAYAIDFGESHSDGVGIHLNKDHGNFDNGTLGAYVYERRLNGPDTMDATAWHHIVVTTSNESDNGDRMRMYIDGQKVATHHQTMGDLNQSHPLTIGRTAKSNDRAWDGQIDDVAIFSGQLNPRQVQLLASGEASPADLATMTSWDFRNDSFTASADPSATASAWSNNGRWRYMYAETDGQTGDLIGTGAPLDFTDMSRYNNHVWDDGNGNPSIRLGDFTVHPDDARAPVIAWESNFDGTIEYYYELIENNNSADADPGYQLFHWDESQDEMSLLAQVDVFADDPSTLNDWETLLGTLNVGIGDMLYMAIDGGQDHGNDRTRINAFIRQLPSVPEPSTFALGMLGILGLAWTGIRRRR